jgi:arabinose-5-phosphate isomerase
MDTLELMIRVIRNERLGLESLEKRMDSRFVQAAEAIAACTGKVVVSGVGKSGIVGRKIAATLSSTGTTAVFLHPLEAQHGDLGVVSRGDLALLIGKSGESVELLSLLGPLKAFGVRVLSIVGRPESTLAQQSDWALDASVDHEADPLDLAPTTSAIVAQAIGDALAIAVMRIKKFEAKDFARVHPSGALGKRLALQVQEVMIPRERLPVLNPQASFEQVVSLLSRAGLGVVFFSKDQNALSGLLSDGDLRRLLEKLREKIFSVSWEEVMNSKPLSVSAVWSVGQALEFMEKRERPLNFAPVEDAQGRWVGLVRLHELLRLA